MNDALDPVVGVLGRIAVSTSSADRKVLCSQALQITVSAAAELIGPERTRACWLVVDGNCIKPGGVYDGRAGKPGTILKEGDPAGKAAFEMIRSNAFRFCADTSADPPPGWDASIAHDYRTFIAVTVAAGGHGYGILTVDSPEPGDLTVKDVEILRMLADLMAVALALGS